MPQQAMSTGAIRSAKRRPGSSGHRRRVLMTATGTAKSSPPNDERPPCQMARTWPGWCGVVGEVGHHMEGPGADDGGDDHPHEHAGDPPPGVAGPAQAPLGVAEAEPEGQGQADPVGVDLQEPDVERDGDGSHGAGGLMVEECPIRRRNRHPSSMPQAPGRVAPGRVRRWRPRPPPTGPTAAERRGRPCETWPALLPLSPEGDRGSDGRAPTALPLPECRWPWST